MAKWINRSLVQAAANGTTSHTITFTAATSGNFLVLVMEGSVTHTVPTGWTRRNQALNNTELSVYTKTASAGESSFSTTHNGSNYPVGAVIYEFPAGATWVGGVSGTGVGLTAANPSLTGLTGTNLLFGAVAAGVASTDVLTSNTTWTGTPTPTEDTDALALKGTTDGYALSIAYAEDSTATSFAPTGAMSYNAANAANKEALTFAVNVPAGGGVSGTASFSATGTVTTAGSPGLTAAPAVSGAGTLAVSGAPRPAGAVSVGASGTLVASGVPTFNGAVSLSATATLTTAMGGFTGTAALGGMGTLTVSGVASVAGTALLSGQGVLTAQGAPTVAAAIALGGVGGLIVTGVPALAAAVALSAVGTLAARPTAPEVDITVTATLDPRRWGASLPARNKSAVLLTRRWKGTLE